MKIKLILITLLLATVSFKPKGKKVTKRMQFPNEWTCYLHINKPTTSDKDCNLTDIHVNEARSILLADSTTKIRMKVSKNGLIKTRFYWKGEPESKGSFVCDPNDAEEPFDLVRNGKWYYYDTEGKRRLKMIYRNDQTISTKIYGCPNNCLFINDIKRDISAKAKKKIEIKLCGDTTMSFQLLKCNGISTGKYYHNGKLFMKGYYMDGNKNGLDYQSYYCEKDEWADIPSECMVLIKDGLWKHYNEGGKLIKEEKWKADSLISVKTLQ